MKYQRRLRLTPKNVFLRHLEVAKSKQIIGKSDNVLQLTPNYAPPFCQFLLTSLQLSRVLANLKIGQSAKKPANLPKNRR